MTKKDIINVVQEIYVDENGKKVYSKKELADIWGEFENAIIEGVKKDGEVVLPRFMKFKAVDVPARTGRNPMTGEAINIPAKKKVKISALSGIKTAFEE